jgi:RNA polymerase sigma factor (sigma-70 family)
MAKDPRIQDLESTLEQSKWLRALAVHLVGPDRADDLMQDACVKALEKPPRKEGSLPQWLARVLHNSSLNERRSERRRRRREERVGLAQPSEEQAADETVAMLEVHKQLVEAVSNLREPYRSAVVLRFFENLTTRQIANRLGIPQSTARNRLSKGLLDLRRSLESKYGPGWRDSTLAALFPSTSPLIPSTISAFGMEQLIMTAAKKFIAIAGALALLTGALFWPPAGGSDSAEASQAAEAILATEASNGSSNDSNNHATPEKISSVARQPSLPEDAALSVRLISENGMPIPGARVRVFETIRGVKSLARMSMDYFFPEMKPAATTESDSNGVASFKVLPEDGKLAIYADAPGFAGRVRVEENLDFSSPVDLGDWKLQVGHYLSLQLTGDDGSIVRGARVRCSGPSPHLPNTMEDYFEYSDERGMVHFQSLNPNTDLLVINPPGFVHYQENEVSTSPTPLAARTVTLKRGGSIDLTVLEADGSPAGGVEVYYDTGGFGTPIVRLNPQSHFYQGKADDNGHLILWGMKKERASHAIAVRRGMAWAVAEGLQAGKSVTLRLPQVHTIRGMVLLNSGAPAQGAKCVLLNENDPALPPDFDTLLEETGDFTAQLSAGNYRLACWHSSGTYFHPERITLDQDLDLGQLEIGLPSQHVIRVIDQDGKGISDARIQAPMPRLGTMRGSFPSQEHIDAILAFLGNEVLLSAIQPFEDSPGTFEIANLLPGAHKLVVRADGYQPAEIQIEILEDSIAETTVVLEATAELYLKVLDAAGQSPIGTTIALSPVGYDRFWHQNGADRPKLTPTNFQTNASGEIHFPSIGIGEWEVGRWGPVGNGFYWRTIQVEPGTNRYEIEMPTLSTLTLQVIGPSGPVQGARINIRREWSRLDQRFKDVGISRGGFGGETDESGEWKLDGMESDTYRIRVFSPGSFPIQQSLQINESNTRFKIQLKGAAISGTVTTPPPGTTVYLAQFKEDPVDKAEAIQKIQNFFWDSSADGYVAIGGGVGFGSVHLEEGEAFQFSGIPNGVYYLVARANDHLPSQPVRLEVKDTDISIPPIRLQPAGSVTLKIKNLNDLMDAYPGVQIYTSGKGSSGESVSARPVGITKDGDYIFEPLAPGAIKIEIGFYSTTPLPPRVTLQCDVRAGETTTVHWDAVQP